MKKLALYLIIFISVFIGTASCVILNGYTNYHQEKDSIQPAVQEDSILTTLASSVIQSEGYTGDIKFYSADYKTNIFGSFVFVKNDSFSLKIKLNGKIENFNVDTTITLVDDEIFIDFNTAKVVLTTGDLLTALNSVIGAINLGAGSNFENINLDSLTSSLTNIKQTQVENGYTLSLPLPNICDIFVLTDNEYLPKQVLVTNLKFLNTTFTLNISAKQNTGNVEKPNKDEYLALSSSIDYIKPILHTLSQSKLRLCGQVTLNSTTFNMNLYKNGNIILGNILYNGLKLEFEFSGGYIYVKLYNNYFKFKPNEAIDLIKEVFNVNITEPLTVTDINLVNFASNINASIETKNNLISKLNISFNGINANFNVGKTLIMPKLISSTNANFLNIKDVKNFISYFSSAISTNYSLTVNINAYDISLTGKAYIELDDKFSRVNELLFDGKVNGKILKLWFHPNATYIIFDQIKLKLDNASIPQLFNSLGDLFGSSSLNLDEIINNITLNDITYKNRSITLNLGKNSLCVTSYINKYDLDINYENININAVLYPNSCSFEYINNELNENEFIDVSNAPKLIDAVKNTINQSSLVYSGNLTVDILDYRYTNILIDITYNSSGSLIITLDNLPLDSVVTYYSHLYYTNQKCVLTIFDGLINIYTTVTTRAFNRTACTADKTLFLKDFSIDHLYDIMGLRKNIIEQLTKQTFLDSSYNLQSNLTPECVTLLKTRLKFNTSIAFNKYIANLSLNFNYNEFITGVTAKLNIGSIIKATLILRKQ